MVYPLADDHRRSPGSLPTTGGWLVRVWIRLSRPGPGSPRRSVRPPANAGKAGGSPDDGRGVTVPDSGWGGVGPSGQGATGGLKSLQEKVQEQVLREVESFTEKP